MKEVVRVWFIGKTRFRIIKTTRTRRFWNVDSFAVEAHPMGAGPGANYFLVSQKDEFSKLEDALTALIDFIELKVPQPKGAG